MGSSRQEYWNGLPFPSTEDLLHPGIEPASPAVVGGFFTTAPSRKPLGGGGNSKNSPNHPQSLTYFFLKISSTDDVETYKNYVEILCNIWGSYEDGKPGELFAKTSAGKMG